MFKLKYGIFLLSILFIAGCTNTKNDKKISVQDSIRIADSLKSAAKPDDFIFVGNNNGLPSLYKYSFENKKASPFWSKLGYKVVDLSYSPNRKAAFFLVARFYGKRGVFPYFRGAKLYRINIDSNKVYFVEDIGKGMQVFTKWENDNSFKVVKNVIDLTVANYVNQHTQIFSKFGKVMLDETKTFDITKDGYPKPLVKKKNVTSKDGKFSIVSSGKDTVSIFLKSPDNQKHLIIKSAQKLNEIGWSFGGKYVVVSTINVTPGNNTLYSKHPETSNIIIYSLKDFKIVNQWSGGGEKNFYIDGNSLIFDNGFKIDSFIEIYNLNQKKSFDTIKIKGGCGLNHIPAIPDYSA